jgi:hypothetical protein
VFTYNFRIIDDSELIVVVKDDATGLETALTLNSDYTVTGVRSIGGTVVLSSAPGVGYTLAVALNTPLTQLTRLLNANDFDMTVLEDILDKQTNQIKTLAEQVNRALKVSISSSGDAIDELFEETLYTTQAVMTAMLAEANASKTAASGYASNASGYAADAETSKDDAALYAADASGYAADAALYAAGSGQKTFLDEPTPPTSSSGITLWGENSGASTDLHFITKNGVESYVVKDDRVYLGDAVPSDIPNHDHTGESSGGNIYSGTGSSASAARADHYHPICIISEVKASGVDGGTFNTGLQTRDLNSKPIDEIGVTLSGGNTFQLPAGTYLIEAWCPAYYVSAHAAIIYDLTGAGVVGYGKNAYSSVYTQSDAYVVAKVTPSSNNQYQVKHRGTISRSTDGFGKANSFIGQETYTMVKITQLSN